MATRFYFDDTIAPLISPAFDAGWEQIGAANRRFSPRKGLVSSLSTLTNKVDTVPITTTQQILSRQYLTEPIPYPVRISGTFSMVLRTLESATTANAFLAFVLRLLSQDGGTIRGTLASSMTNAGTEYAATAATRIFSAIALTPITAQPGDILCLEVGGHAQAPTAATTYTHRYGVAQVADFALTSALTTDLNPWWELDQTLWPSFSANTPRFRGADGASVTEGWR